MKKIYPLLFCLLSITAAGQQKPRNVKQEITWLKNSLSQHHVEPKAIDDKYSSDLFDKFVDNLDPDKIFFTGQDIASLESYRNLLDDEINGRNTGFLNTFKERYKKGLQRSEKMINSILDSPIDWQRKEMYDPKEQRAEDDQKLTDRYRQWLKHRILERMTDIVQRDTVVKAGLFQKHVGDVIPYVRMSCQRPVVRLLTDPVVYDNEVSDAFLEAMATLFDPHSNFFSRRDYDDFVASLSTEDYYFGFTLGEDSKGNVVISSLAPGGAAWKSGALHVSDILVAIKWPDEERIDVRGMNIEDVNELLDSNRGILLEMTIRTVDGHEKKVGLRKEKLESEGNVVQSFVLQGEIKTGYIYLPDFYTRWDEEQEGGRCANDVAKEIIKLKMEGIQGLILDLRFNGGGSLYEARAMAGIFIDEGPLAMVRTQDKKTVSLKDINRGTVYDGPLAIMVNGGSASASEVLAASIQDYNRGLIVGSRTYGKATGQNILPLDGLSAVTTSKKSPGGAGYVKVTTQRLYRVTGKSAQARGVTPDVAIPDIFRVLDVSEREQPFYLRPDSIPMNIYYKPLIPFRRKELQERSRERLSKNTAFQELLKTITWLEGEIKKNAGPQPLLWENYLKATEEASRHRITRDMTVDSDEKLYEVNNAAAKEERLTVDGYARQINDRWKKILTTDLYVQETYQILRDHIVLTKNP